jgi:hypothetical protein
MEDLDIQEGNTVTLAIKSTEVTPAKPVTPAVPAHVGLLAGGRRGVESGSVRL